MLSNTFHRRLLDTLYDGVYFVDPERKITYWNHGAENLTGFTAAEVIGRRCYDNLLMHVNDEGCHLCHCGCPLAQTIEDGQQRQAEIYLRHKSGHRVPVSVRVAPVRDEIGQIIGAVEVFSDASQKKAAERRVIELEQLAFHDSLTGIPNRRYITLKVEQALQELREFSRTHGLLMLDVDHFKRVNDVWGHDTGDAVLRAVSDTLVNSLRPSDRVGRWGGEEFLVILVDATSDTLQMLAERCCTLIAQCAIPVNGNRISVTASVGATLLREGDSPQTAIQRADTLLYRSKLDGRNRSTTEIDG